jgi:5-methylcytosine-specific restriction endonuclease McrA
MPSAKAIRAYWAPKLWERKGYYSAEDFVAEGACFACGRIWGRADLERAHILPVCEGGSDSVENLHLLCHLCHKDSEFKHGERYWQWFYSRTPDDAFISLLVRTGHNASEYMSRGCI